MALVDIFFDSNRFDNATMKVVAEKMPDLVHDALETPDDKRPVKPVRVRITPHGVHDVNMPAFEVRAGLHENSTRKRKDFNAFADMLTTLLREHLDAKDKKFVYDGLDSFVRVYELPKAYIVRL